MLSFYHIIDHSTGLGADASKPRCKKRKELLKEKKLAKAASKGETVSDKQTSPVREILL